MFLLGTLYFPYNKINKKKSKFQNPFVLILSFNIKKYILHVFKLKSELKKFLISSENKIIGFVPTMGALHEGHISLINASIKKCDITVCSIFVNPTQFNDKNDLLLYPRTLEKDIMLLQNAGCQVLFCPDTKEMYPEEDKRTFDFGFLGNTLDALHRPGHFNGVAQIVSKLFEIVQPQFAFFGEKDYQQVLIVKEMVKQLQFNVSIISCPIERENDGLAMSSRNMLLSEDERKAASLIPNIMKSAKEDLNNGITISTIKERVTNKLIQEKIFRLDYFEVRDAITLQEVSDDSKSVVLLIALFCGKIRLIDNCVLN
jgi:pantoate--beta-alanine ligase